MVKHPLRMSLDMRCIINIFESHLPESIVIRSRLLTAGEKITPTLKTTNQQDKYYSYCSDMHDKAIPN